VLPELKSIPSYALQTPDGLAHFAKQYGLQCWNAAIEQVAGPLREELAAVLSDWNALVQAIGSPTNGGAVAHARMLRERVAELERELHRQRELFTGASAAADIYEAKYDRLRAENEALLADAERYRWLRDTMKYRACADVLNNHMRSGWDAAIDAARAAKENA